MKNKLKVLLVEDNFALAKQITAFLSGHGWVIDFAATGSLAIKLSTTQSFDVVILDLNLPDIDGLEVCQSIKKHAKTNIPVLMLTARDAYEDKSQGFSSGADDYLTKPFDLRELSLRCQALSKRNTLHESAVLELGAMKIDNRAFTIHWQQQPVKLTRIGFVILKTLADAYPYPVSRSDIIEAIWGEEPPESNALKSHIYSLRKALEAVNAQDLLGTISNVGYQLQHIELN